MNKLTFNASKSICHKIVTDSKGKKYLMDTSTISPNVFGFGFLPKRVRVEMVEIDKKSRLFDKKTKVNGASVAVGGALASTPILSKLIMNLVRGRLDSHHIHEQPFLKYGIFLGIFILAFLIAQVMIGVSRFRVSKNFLQILKSILLHLEQKVKTMRVFIFLWLLMQCSFSFTHEQLLVENYY